MQGSCATCYGRRMNRLPLLVEGLCPEALVILVDDVLADLDSDTRREVLRDPIWLGLCCEVRLSGLDSDELLGLLTLRDGARLAELAEKALLDRLPAI